VLGGKAFMDADDDNNDAVVSAEVFVEGDARLAVDDDDNTLSSPSVVSPPLHDHNEYQRDEHKGTDLESLEKVFEVLQTAARRILTVASTSLSAPTPDRLPSPFSLSPTNNLRRVASTRDPLDADADADDEDEGEGEGEDDFLTRE
jgi:hypothetical protein